MHNNFLVLSKKGLSQFFIISIYAISLGVRVYIIFLCQIVLKAKFDPNTMKVKSMVLRP
jgi:type IV secretory pathway TrbD component